MYARVYIYIHIYKNTCIWAPLVLGSLQGFGLRGIAGFIRVRKPQPQGEMVGTIGVDRCSCVWEARIHLVQASFRTLPRSIAGLAGVPTITSLDNGFSPKYDGFVERIYTKLQQGVIVYIGLYAGLRVFDSLRCSSKALTDCRCYPYRCMSYAELDH